MQLNWASLNLVLATVEKIKVAKEHVMLECSFIYATGLIDWLELQPDQLQQDQLREETIGKLNNYICM